MGVDVYLLALLVAYYSHAVYPDVPLLEGDPVLIPTLSQEDNLCTEGKTLRLGARQCRQGQDRDREASL